MKIILAGGGKVGKTLADQLSSENYDITVIDDDPAVIESAVESFDVMAVKGNCASMNVLRQAGAMTADLLIAATGTDEVNLLSCMTAHALNPKLHTIARICNPEYNHQAYAMRDAFGLSLTFNPDKQAAEEIVRLLKLPGFLKRETFAKGRVEIVEIRIDEDSPLCNIALSDISGIVKCKILICTVLRDGRAISPAGNFILEKDDRIFVTATTDNLALLLKNIGIVTHKNKNVTIVGGGKIGYYLAESLENSSISAQIIEMDEERCKELAASLPHTNIIHGNGGFRETLESEGVPHTDALIALTGMDEVNMVISLYGDRFGVPQSITKLDRIDDSKVVAGLPLGSIICPKRLCCSNILRYVRAMQNQAGAATTIHTIADGLAEAIEFPVDGTTLHCGEPLRKFKLKQNILLVSITKRNGVIEIPSGDSFFEKGDSVVIVSSRKEVILHLNDIFAE